MTRAYVVRGQVNLVLDQYDAAEIALSEAIKLSRHLPEAFVLRSRAYLAFGREGQAARDIEIAERLKGG
mgnify:CR=1 FL=1